MTLARTATTVVARIAPLTVCFAIATLRFGDAQTSAMITPAIGGVAWTSDAVATLSRDLDAQLSGAVAIRGAHVGVLAVDTGTGEVLYERHADEEFQPASTLKLLVGSAALEKLGPTFRFRTELDLTVRDVSASTRPFDSVVLRAGGDPFLSDRDLQDAARLVATQRISPLLGVSIDDSHFDETPYPAGWVWDDFAQSYAARIAAIALEENVVHLTVSPGLTVGSRAGVTAGLGAFVGTPIEGCVAALPNFIAVEPNASTGPRAAESTVDVAVAPGGCLEVVGTIPLGARAESIDAAVYDPVAYAQRALTDALRADGLTLNRFTVIGPADAPVRRTAAQGFAERPLWTHESPSLAQFLGPRFWIPSDNFVAEMLLRQVGFAAAGKPGTTETGTAYERTWLRSIGVDPATTTLADGSGLSQYDRITPRDLVAILQHDWSGPNRQLVLDSLPVGGARGTIEGIAGTPAAGRVFAKTGSMSHVRG
ncbi:MAG: D-alanyl-D-alanine carboxypeptidase/D-alanyl-D-alanine-endopeptidase, partial [Candidatus Eremiobacteraeota bacterium]|nr:D-alanyl-D-alanine carboxypeptidase/D-alanyl-D-alanine-endopeptidase [Candidatus Eremiobacteraeota bacterium]